MKAGRAGAAARKVKQERLLEDVRTARESFQRSEAPSSAEPAEQSFKKYVAQKEVSWTPWILGASCLVIPVSADR